jgi:hypothetical protein
VTGSVTCISYRGGQGISIIATIGVARVLKAAYEREPRLPDDIAVKGDL